MLVAHYYTFHCASGTMLQRMFTEPISRLTALEFINRWNRLSGTGPSGHQWIYWID